MEVNIEQKNAVASQKTNLQRYRTFTKIEMMSLK